MIYMLIVFTILFILVLVYITRLNKDIYIPSQICSKKIDITQYKNSTIIGDDFLSKCGELEEFNMSNLYNLKKIGNNFLSNNPNLSKIVIDGLDNVSSIGDSFISNCGNNNDATYIYKLKLHLPRLKSVGNDFLSNSNFFTGIILNNSFFNVEAINNNFLRDSMIDFIDIKI